eukprot:11503857-Prorocentrum_lima.AAC.1
MAFVTYMLQGIGAEGGSKTTGSSNPFLRFRPPDVQGNRCVASFWGYRSPGHPAPLQQRLR